MAVKVRRGMLDHMVAYSGQCEVQIQEADDLEAACAALEAAANDLEFLPSPDEPTMAAPSYVRVEPDAEGGPMLVIDMHDLGELMPTVLDIVKRCLEESGVQQAVVGWPERGLWPASRREDCQRWVANDRGAVGWCRVVEGEFHLDPALKDRIPRDHVPAAVILRVFAMPARGDALAEVPNDWLVVATNWVTRNSERSDSLWVGSGLDEFRIPTSTALQFLEAHRRKRQQCHVVSGDVDGRVRAVNAVFVKESPNIAIAGGGPATTRDEMVHIAEELIGVAQRLAPTAAYAYITMLPTFSDFWGEIPGVEWSEVTTPPARGPIKGVPAELVAKFSTEYCGGVRYGARPAIASTLCDEFVFDAFPYQILSPGHLDRLGEVPPDTEPLGARRAGLRLGELHSWLPIRPEDHLSRPWWLHLDLSAEGERLRDEGRRLLARCLLMNDEAYAIRSIGSESM